MELFEVKSRAGVVAARLCFTDRIGGHSLGAYASLNLATHVGDAAIAVAANRAEVAKAIGVPADRVTWPGLIHSTDVGIVDSRQSVFPGVDVLVTRMRGQALATMSADCVPVVAVDPEAGVALTAHIGWQGAAAGGHLAIISALAQSGASTRATRFFLGPAICGGCYRVTEDRIAAVAAQLPAAAVPGGLDLRAGLAAVLGNVTLVGGCTFEDPNLFSHRREQPTGRQGALVVLV